MAQIRLHIDGLEGPEDEQAIREALADVTGVYAICFDRVEPGAEIDAEDDEVSIDLVLERLRGAGYPARLTG